VLDGDLNDRSRVLTFGHQVAKRLLDMSSENGWEAPYIVGASADITSNWALKGEYPDHYIGEVPDVLFAIGHARRETELFNAIDSKL
jgi:hypothetical protein